MKRSKRDNPDWVVSAATTETYAERTFHRCGRPLSRTHSAAQGRAGLSRGALGCRITTLYRMRSIRIPTERPEHSSPKSPTNGKALPVFGSLAGGGSAAAGAGAAAIAV
jgi:hypothetical protein